MIRSAILAFGAIAALSVPASAEYYIVHGADRHCRVVESYSPEQREIVRVGPLRIGTREEAERQVRVVCRDNGSYREERHEERRGERHEEQREHRY